MNDKLNFIQNKLIEAIERLDSEKNNVIEEISRSNAISGLANTYIKSCNLIIRLEECSNHTKAMIKQIDNE